MNPAPRRTKEAHGIAAGWTTRSMSNMQARCSTSVHAFSVPDREAERTQEASLHELKLEPVRHVRLCTLAAGKEPEGSDPEAPKSLNRIATAPLQLSLGMGVRRRR
jgi:hypothetical protein